MNASLTSLESLESRALLSVLESYIYSPTHPPVEADVSQDATESFWAFDSVADFLLVLETEGIFLFSEFTVVSAVSIFLVKSKTSAFGMTGLFSLTTIGLLLDSDNLSVDWLPEGDHSIRSIEFTALGLGVGCGIGMMGIFVACLHDTTAAESNALVDLSPQASTVKPHQVWLATLGTLAVVDVMVGSAIPLFLNSFKFFCVNESTDSSIDLSAATDEVVV